MKKESFQGILLGVVIMCAVFAFITVAWAAFSSTLTIGGTAKVLAQKWQVEFGKTANTAWVADSPATYQALTPVLTNDATVDSAAAASNFRLSSASAAEGYIATLSRPGSKVVYTWYVNNLGTFGADFKLTGDLLSAATANGTNVAITCTNADNSTAATFCSTNVKAILTIDGTTVVKDGTFALGQKGSAGSSKEIVLTLEYIASDSTSALSSQDINISLATGITLTATQSSTTQATTTTS